MGIQLIYFTLFHSDRALQEEKRNAAFHILKLAIIAII